MCIEHDGYHSGGTYFVYVNDFCYYINCMYVYMTWAHQCLKEQVKELMSQKLIGFLIHFSNLYYNMNVD